MSCPRYIRKINSAQNIGDSLISLNNNFYSIRNTLCSFQQKLDSIVNTRTFFYYGPNSGIDPTSGMDHNKSTRPSDSTIKDFINNTLNLPQISKRGDEAYVIYQKTGFVMNKAIQQASGTVTARVISFSQEVAWSAEIDNRYDTYSPVFIIWKLTYVPVPGSTNYTYQVDAGFPKYIQSETFSTVDWKQPDKWNSRF